MKNFTAGVSKVMVVLTMLIMTTSCWWVKKDQPVDPYPGTGLQPPTTRPTDDPGDIGRPLGEGSYTEAVRVPESEIRTVYFDYDRSEIRSDQIARMENNAQFLANNPEKRIRIDGHCDERGSLEYNIALGARRANQVKDFFVSRGVDPDRILTISRGEEEPAVQGTGEAVWSLNRRAEFYYIR